MGACRERKAKAGKGKWQLKERFMLKLGVLGKEGKAWSELGFSCNITSKGGEKGVRLTTKRVLWELDERV